SGSAPRTRGATVGALRKRAPKPAPEAGASAEPAAPTPPRTKAKATNQPGGAPAASVDVDDVILAWAAALPELPVATRSAVHAAQSRWVEGDVVTSGVPPRLTEAAKPRFRREADTIRDALSQRVGQSLRFNLIAHEGFIGERTSMPAPAAEPVREPDDVI